MSTTLSWGWRRGERAWQLCGWLQDSDVQAYVRHVHVQVWSPYFLREILIAWRKYNVEPLNW